MKINKQRKEVLEKIAQINDDWREWEDDKKEIRKISDAFCSAKKRFGRTKIFQESVMSQYYNVILGYGSLAALASCLINFKNKIEKKWA